MKDVTISMDDDLARKARVEAAQQGKSLGDPVLVPSFPQ
jgi:plasmid stability protein